MRLENFTILNYRSCKALDIPLSKEDPDVFIGINDCGKSTILKALELFFDSKQPIFFENDKSVRKDLSNTPLSIEELETFLMAKGLPKFEGYNADKIILIGHFAFEEKIADDLISEQLLLVQDKLESFYMAKIFDSVTTAGTYFLLNEDWQNQEIWNKSENQLKTLMGDNSVNKDMATNVNDSGKLTKVERMRAILKVKEAELKSSWSIYNFKKDSPYFSVFRLFNWNSNLDDLKKMVVDSMSESIKDIKSTINEQAKKASCLATEKVNEKLSEIADLLIADGLSVTSVKTNVNFSVLNEVTDILVGKEGMADGTVHIESQGDGIKRQIWFAITKWSSEQSIANKGTYKRIIWAFDEPETHLYPTAQREFMSALQKLTRGSYQILISTHSTVFVDKSKFGNVNKLFLENMYSKINACSNVEDVYDALRIKNSDFLFYDKFLAVEGVTEFDSIPHLYSLHYGTNLVSDNIQLINLGGKDNRNHYKKILDGLIKDFSDSKKSLFYLLDADSNCSENNIFTIGKMDFEDSLPNSLWLKIIKELFPTVTMTEEDLDELRTKIDKHNKFWGLLRAKVRAISPGSQDIKIKGVLPNLIKNHITKAEIPNAIIEVFEKLKNTNG